MLRNKLTSLALGGLLCLALSLSAFAQQAVLQGGPWKPGHIPMYVGSGSSQPILSDSGGAGGGATGINPGEFGLTIRNPLGVYPAANVGSGPFNTNWCDYDAPTTNPTGYHYLCMSPNAQGGGLLAYGAGGTASQLPFNIRVNGASYQIPFNIGGIVGPTTTVIGDIALWNNTTGSLLKDVAVLPAVNGGAGTVNGALKANGAGLVTQAACSDLSNAATGCSTATGTSGATVPLNNGGFTQSGTANFSGTTNFTGPVQVNGNVQTFPASAASLARTDAGQTFTGVQTFSTPIAPSSVATMTSTVGGGVPTPPNDATTFLNGAGAFTAPAFQQAPVDNLLPNTQWQLWSGVQYIAKQNPAGTASQTGSFCTSFTTTSAAPTFSCSNTSTIKTNDLAVVTTGTLSNPLVFWGFAGSGYTTCAQVNCTGGFVTAARVSALTTNTSIQLAAPGMGGVSLAASQSTQVIPIAPGDPGSSGNGADGWTKSNSLVATVDDFGAAATPASTVYPGAIRPLLLRKGINGSEIYAWHPTANQIKQYQGRTITCGAAVYQRVQGGGSTFNLQVGDSAGTTTSANGTGASLGGYQFITVTRTISQTATSAFFVFNLTGASGDVFDIALPTCAFVSQLAQSQLGQNSHELIRATSHWNPPLLTPDIINWPASELVVGSGLYGYNGNDIEAMSFGTMHNSVGNVYAKVEWKTGTVGAYVFMSPNVNVTNGLTFGPQTITIVANVNNVAGGRWPLYHDGTGAIYGTNPSLATILGTWDFWDVEVGPGNSVD